MKISFKLLLGFLLLLPIVVKAQVGLPTGQYMFTPLIVNPAYAGTEGSLNITSVNRMSWLGMQGDAKAPKNIGLLADAGLPYHRIGLGMALHMQEINVHQRMSFQGMVSYHLSLNKTWDISAGLLLGGNHYSVNYERLNIQHTNDPVYQDTYYEGWRPQVGTGIYLSGKGMQLGVSIPRLMEYRGILNSRVFEQAGVRVTALYDWWYATWLHLKPSVMLNFPKGAAVEMDYSLLAFYKDVLGLGITYKWGSTIGGLSQVQLSRKWKLGYLFELPVGQRTSLNGVAHELMLQFQLGAIGKERVSPRSFYR
ncbi:PorP/SprF family type IX secretion system membrane protein [Algivirga pacifica]|uniref:Type IX secretion system membrane protein PorP/SprF n=1 Tax=Algivirga pacifica TaxID=1162670 RepID=A0ABP9DFK0_9BACT